MQLLSAYILGIKNSPEDNESLPTGKQKKKDKNPSEQLHTEVRLKYIKTQSKMPFTP